MTITWILFKTFAKEFLHRLHTILLAPMFLILSCLIFGIGLRNGLTNLDATSIASLLVILSLFSILLCSDSLFYPLVQGQSLVLFLLHPISLRQVVLLRIFTHWLFHIAPTALLTPAISALFLTDTTLAFFLVIPLLLGSLSLTLLNALIAALTIGLPSGAFFSAIFFLPLATPLLVFTLISTSPISPDIPATSTFSALLLLLVSVPILTLANLFITPILLRQILS